MVPETCYVPSTSLYFFVIGTEGSFQLLDEEMPGMPREY